MAITKETKCSVCNKKIRNHELLLECSLCNNPIHTRCLPFYSEIDIEYAKNTSKNWSCISCLKEIFPFFELEDNQDISNYNILNDHNINIEKAKNLIFDPYEDTTEGNEEDDIILDTAFDIIILSETWLKPYNVDIYKLDGYNHEYITRDDKAGGVLSIYIKDSIQYNLLTDLNINTNDIEMVWLEIKKENLLFEKYLIIGGMYRRPGSNPNSFIEILSEKLHIIKQMNKQCIYAGDFNLDLLKYKSHNPTNDFINLNFALSYTPQINRPTRITSDTATIIDNLFSNLPLQNDCTNGIILTDLSDHFPIFTLISKLPKK
jgi:hypothetical protein